MLEEATELGAHGVVGVVDTVSRLTDANVTEFHMSGTAVKVLDTPARRQRPGARICRAASREGLRSGLRAGVDCRVRLINPGVASCVTEYLMEGMACGQTRRAPRDRTDRHRDVSSALHVRTSRAINSTATRCTARTCNSVNESSRRGPGGRSSTARQSHSALQGF